MKENLRIGDIPIQFIYQFNDFFHDVLQQYRTNDLGDDYYRLEVYVMDNITDIESPDKLVYRNKVRHRIGDETYLVTYNRDLSVRHLISYSSDYKQITIKLSKNLKSKLAEWEYILSGMLFFEIAISNDYLPIHASAIALKNQAFLLSGPSKSGKSTQTDFFMSAYPDSLIVNEDKPLLYERNNKIYVCGSPWSGKRVVNKNLQVELKQIFFVNKADQISIKKLDHREKLKLLMKNIHRPSEEFTMDKAILLVDKIITHVDLMMFDCINDQISSQKLWEYMGAYK